MVDIIYTLNLASEIKKKWDFFIKEHPLPHFFQSSAYFNLYVGEFGSSPFLFYAIEDNKIIGVLCGLLLSNRGFLKKEFSKRVVFTGAPLIHPNYDPIIIGKKLIDAYLNKFPYSHIFSEFRMSNSIEIFSQKLFKKEQRCNIYVDTQKSSDLIFKKIHSSKRRQINNSLKNGAIIEKAINEKDVIDYYEILSNFYKYKVNKPLPSIKLFLKFLDTTKEKNIGEILLVKYEEKIIAGIVCPCVENGYVHEWYICGLDNEYKKFGIYPSVLATWAGISYSIECGVKYFDFMGAGKLGEPYGVRNFKEKFGGENIITTRYLLINKPILYKIGKLAIKLGFGA